MSETTNLNAAVGHAIIRDAIRVVSAANDDGGSLDRIPRSTLTILCDAAERGRELEGSVWIPQRLYDKSREELAELEATVAAVTKERDEALASAADVIGRHHEAVHAEILARAEAAEAALAPLRAVVEKLRVYVDLDRNGSWNDASDAFLAMTDTLSALPADPSAPTPVKCFTEGQLRDAIAGLGWEFVNSALIAEALFK